MGGQEVSTEQCGLAVHDYKARMVKDLYVRYSR